ncbi:MAG TPA: PQQ-binding-like beta-propeller repeat protein [Vicinamibacteria bacterium]|nr:PQQ-binding-like beta-propeller repeat protein [Vicinamibacteria bacterium]
MPRDIRTEPEERSRYAATLRSLVSTLVFSFILHGSGFVTVAAAISDDSNNWPGFRGPGSIPVSSNPRLPELWSTSQNVEWVTEVSGVGWSSPIVWGRRIFLTSATSDQPMKQPSLGTDFSNDYIAELRAEGLPPEEIEKRLWERDREMPHEIVISLMLTCHDLETGKLLWERQIYHGNPKGGRHRKNSFASETPVTDGEKVYVYSTHLGLYAYDLDGNPMWVTPLEPHQTIRDYGAGASPALHKDRVFILNDNEDQGFIAAFDKETGKEVWRRLRVVEERRKTGWSTPFVWENALRTEVVTVGPGAVTSYDLDGRELWQMKRMAAVSIQSPFARGEILYVTAGSSGGENRPIVAIRPGGSGDITPSEGENKNEHVVWYNQLAGGTYLPTPVIYDGAMYVLYDKGIFARYDIETGERVYRSRIAPGAAAFTASPWAYNGKVFALSEEGDTFVIEAGEKYRLLGVNSLNEWAMATPAIVGDRLIIRTQTRLYSIRNPDQ